MIFFYKSRFFTVTLKGVGGEQFIGFYLQARDANGIPIGTFSPNELTKVHNCGDIKAVSRNL